MRREINGNGGEMDWGRLKKTGTISSCLSRLPNVSPAVSVYQPALAGMYHFPVFEKNICYNNNCSLFLTHDDKNDEHYKAYEEASQQREGFRIVLCVKIISEGLPKREGFFYYNIY